MITRRHTLAALATGLVLPSTPRRLWAASSLNVGDLQIDTLSDGMLVLPVDFILGGMPSEELAEIIARHGLSADRLTPPCNVTLMRDGTNTVLFDVGSGPDFQPTAGKLSDAFQAIGLAPEDVTHVLFTHGHPDHLWGLLDEFDEPVFPNAQLMISRTEFDYWTDAETVDTIGEARTTFAVGAARRLSAVADRIRLVGDGEEVLPGVATVLTPGHTPGHMSWELRSGTESTMVVGDAIGNHHVAFERPDWPSPSDQDVETAAATRSWLLDRISSEQMPLVGFHLPGGGIGRVERADGAYRFVDE